MIIFLIGASLGVGTSFINIQTHKDHHLGIVSYASKNYYLINTGLESFYVKNYDNQYELGDVLAIQGSEYPLDFPVLESDFDFNDYLKNKGVDYGFDVNKCDLKIRNPIRFNRYKEKFLAHFDENTRDFIGSLYFGSGYGNELSSTLKDLHLFRLSTLSGLAIYAILSLLKKLLQIKFSENKASLFAFLLLTPYLVFTIQKFAVFKLCLMFILRLINNAFLNKKFTYMELSSGLGISCLLFDKFLAYQIGFNLSFLLGILLHFYNNSYPFLSSKKRKIFSIVFITLFLLPFESVFYHEITFFGSIFQILLTPLFILISILTTLCFYGIPIYSLTSGLVYMLGTIVNFIKPIFVSVYCPPFPMWFSVLFEAILLLFAYFFAIRFKLVYKYILITSGLLGLYFVPIKPYLSTYISFINIGQGDSTLIHFKGTDILVDTGGSLFKDIARTTLIPFFKKNQIYNIDYLITTHDDFDHIGARDSLMENFRVKNYLNEPSQFPLKIGDFTMNNLNIYCHDSPDENDNSLVLQFSLKNTDILIMGDAPKMIEKSILKDHPDIKCDILKVGHHGSNTSTSYDFVSCLDPDLAIISCGKNNKYGHPHDEVLSVLNSLAIPYRRTDVESTITIYF